MDEMSELLFMKMTGVFFEEYLFGNGDEII